MHRCLVDLRITSNDIGSVQLQRTGNKRPVRWFRVPLHPRQLNSDRGQHRDLDQQRERYTYSDYQRHCEYWTAELCFRTHSSGRKFLVHFHSDGNLSLLRLWLYLHERNCPCEPCSPTPSSPDAELFPGQCWGDSWLEC